MTSSEWDGHAHWLLLLEFMNNFLLLPLNLHMGVLVLHSDGEKDVGPLGQS